MNSSAHHPSEPSDPVLPDFLRSDELARMLQVSRLTITRWIAARKIPFYRFGRQIRHRREDILHFLKASRCGTMSELIDEMESRKHKRPF